MTEEEMVRWHYRLNGHEFEQTVGYDEGQGNLMFGIHKLTKSQTRLSD